MQRKNSMVKKSTTISRMLKESELKHPEIYFIGSNLAKQFGGILGAVLKKYRLKYLSVKILIEESVRRKYSSKSDTSDNQDIAKLIQKRVHKLGNRKYIIEGYPNSVQQLELLKKAFSTVVEFKTFFYIQKQETNIVTQQQFAELLHSLNNDKTVKKIPFTDEASLPSNFEVLLEQDGFQVPPLIPIICILGGPGSGKGTNCVNLVRDYGFRHISTGDLLRGYTEGEWFETINNLMKEGKLVPSDILLQIVKEEIDRYNYVGVYLLDGFPRNYENMQVWNKVMDGFASVELYLYLECDQITMEKRLMGRSQSSGRCDDTPEIIKKRFKTFDTMTVPFIKEILKNQKVITIDSRRTPEEVYADIQSEFLKQGIEPIVKTKQKPSVIFILGGPGSGKGTQCEILVKEYSFKHLSTGDLLRDEIKNNGPEANQIQSYIKEGKLVPSTFLVKLMRNKIQNQGWTGHYLVDGFPRGKDNIIAWYEIMREDVHVDALFYFDCSIQTMESRLLKRGETSGRADDTPAVIKKRFMTFKNETEPFLEFYKKSGGNIHNINADQHIDLVTKNIKAILIKEKLI